jgi:hypothetical protein
MPSFSSDSMTARTDSSPDIGAPHLAKAGDSLDEKGFDRRVISVGILGTESSLHSQGNLLEELGSREDFLLDRGSSSTQDFFPIDLVD